jgi:serine phosphatase RsbU (regulator of sigma subunit)
LFLYTDGLTEARSGGELFGEERLFQLLACRGGESSGDIARRVLEEVLRFAGGRLNDDLAVLDVKRLSSVDEAPRP